jgi:PAS domain S-box-containing protein
MIEAHKNIRFLREGGEMGELIRTKDWNKTPVGQPADWPQSLRTTLSIILNSKFPMFLWWGPGLICFYNDAYRPSLGKQGKHPSILGQRAEDAWPEIWEIIKPLIDQVLAGGEATWSEDQLIPIYRNGKIEDVYWTFSYSPVYDESDNVAGVLVTCTETTEKVNTFKRLEESNQNYFNNIMQAPVAMCIFRGENHIVEIANQRMLEVWGKTKEQVLNKPIFEGLPEAKGQGLEQLVNDVYTTGERFVANERPVNLPRNGKVESTYINFVYEALKETDGTISGIVAIASEVTLQVIARKKIEESEERFRMMAESTAILIYVGDETSNATYFNKAWVNLTGRPMAHLVKFGWADLVHTEDREGYVNSYLDAFEKRQPFTGEFRVLNKEGHYNWLLAKGLPRFGADDSFAGYICSCIDISEEKKYQQELLEREQKFRLLADSMPQFVWTGDVKGTMNYFNKSVYNYSGLTPEQMSEDGWLQIAHPDEKEEGIEKWVHSIKTGEEFVFEHRFRKYDGQYRWQLSRAKAQKDDAGKIQMWVGTSTDIDAQKKITSNLKEQIKEQIKEHSQLNEAFTKSEERYHLMVDEIQDYAILYLNKEGIIENWNTGAEKLKGYKAEEIIGKNFAIFYTEAENEKNVPEKQLKQAIETGKAKHEGWRVKKNKDLFWAHVVITTLYDDQKNIVGFSKITHDLTEKKQANDKIKANAALLEEQNRELEKMNAELQSFAYASSHDLQEPLRKIHVFATRILEKEHQNLSETGKDYFNRMQQSVNKMQMLIEDLLTYSRTNTTDQIFKNTDLGELITEVINEFKALEENKATIDIEETCDAVIIPFQFRQLLQNLVSNSLKFSKPGSPAHISIASKIIKGSESDLKTLLPGKMYCHVSVTDNGIGFDPKYKDRIFELFQRLHGKNEYPGTGIGLAIVKKIVDNHNGFITATSELGQGATFTIYIPSA